MARIADEELERLKSEVSLERLVEARGVKLKRHGADLLGLCPFHDDRTPSLVITPKQNLWHCLGACQTGGSVIDWVMRAEGVSFRHAVELLRKDYPSLAADKPLDAEHVVKRASVRKLENFAPLDEPDAIVLGRVLEHYHVTLKQSPEALEYLRERGLVHEELVEHFKLGFSNRTLSYRLPDKNRHAGAVLRSQLQRLGVMRQSGHEHFTGSLVIPILGDDGAVLGMYGRKITPGLREGTPQHLYLPGPHRGVFNVQALAQSKEIIVCEALIDALTFWCAGHCNVTSAYGVEGFTPEYWEAFERHGIERVYIAYDRDDAGNKAAQKLGEELGARGVEALRVLFPRGMDANEYARKVTLAAQSLGTLLRAARWIAGPAHQARVTTAAAAVTSELTRAQPESAAAAEVPSEAPQMVETITQDGEVISLLAADLPPVPASVPAAAEPTSELREADEVTLQYGSRIWRVRGLLKNTSLASIKVSVRVMQGSVFFQDQLEVLSARARSIFLKQASDELGQEERVLKADFGKVILRLEELLEAQLKNKLAPKPAGYQMSEVQERAALSLLRDPTLLERIVSDFERCGVVGEETNKLVGYLAALSRKLEAPLAVVIQSSSAAGKSALMDAVLRFVPDEEQVSYSAMTGQSLFYMGATDLQHKVLGVAEEEGATNAAYALKVLQSSGELTIASTGKDPATGRLVTHEYRVQGPVMVMLTTTSIEINEELLNRCVVLTVDEGREQTRAIQRLQRESRTLEGMMRKEERGHLLELHQNAQRLLLPVHVVNPFARELSFADHATRTRRDHAKYLTLIDTIALLHQHQRPMKTAQMNGAELRYIEVTRADIEVANKLASQVLGRGLDELAPQTRALLRIVDGLVAERAASDGVDRGDVRFTQREVRQYAGWSQTQVKLQLRRLQELEYVAVHYQGHRQRHLYELLVNADEQAPSPFELRKHGYDANRAGFAANRSGTGPRRKSPVLVSDPARVAEPVGDSASTDAAAGGGVSYPTPSLVAVAAH